jgi:hypothetical protein
MYNENLIDYHRAIRRKILIERSGINVGETVICGTGDGAREYVFKGISKGGRLIITPVGGGKTITVHPCSVRYKGRDLTQQQ